MIEKATSDRRRQANRTNATFSTGPKSGVGKARTSRNALRHGLNLSIWSDPTLAPEAEAIARRIAGSKASSTNLELARRIGAAQVDLIRIRNIRREMIRQLQLESDFQPSQICQRKLKSTRLIQLWAA